MSEEKEVFEFGGHKVVITDSLIWPPKTQNCQNNNCNHDTEHKSIKAVWFAGTVREIENCCEEKFCYCGDYKKDTGLTPEEYRKEHP